MKEEYDFQDARRGAVISTPPGKIRITIRLDEDVIDWFRSQVDVMGGNYQTLINQALRGYVQNQKEPLELTLRRVIREELEKYR
jgi:uncharacterized protein (DUF4415 family)